MTFSEQLAEFRRLALTLGGEAMQSGLHFALNLVLLALLPAREYGGFAFTLVLGGVGLTYVRSLVAMPASTYIGRSRRIGFADFYEGAFNAAALALCAVIALLSGLALYATGGPAISGAAMAGLWSLRSHLRTVGYARGQAAAVIAGDAAFAATGALASVFALSLSEARLQGVLIALSCANLVGATVLSLLRGCAPRVDFGARARGFYYALSLRLVWSLYSVTTTILQGQGVAFLVVAVDGPAAFAPIAAMLAFFAPMRIFALSLANMLQPEISRLAADGDDAGWRSMRRSWTLRAVFIAASFGALGLAVLPRLSLRSLDQQPVAFISVCAWGLYAIVLGYLLPRILLEARMRYREVAVITTVGAGFGLALTLALLLVAPAAYAILGGALGEAVAAAATWYAAAGPLKRRRAANLRFSNQEATAVACNAEPLA